MAHTESLAGAPTFSTNPDGLVLEVRGTFKKEEETYCFQVKEGEITVLDGTNDTWLPAEGPDLDAVLAVLRVEINPDREELVLQDGKLVLKGTEGVPSPRPPVVHDKEIYVPGIGFTMQSQVRDRVKEVLAPDDIDAKLAELEGRILPARKVRKVLNQVKASAEVDRDTAAFAYLMDSLHLDTVLSTAGHVTFGFADLALSLANFAYFVRKGLKAGISFSDYLKAMGWQSFDAITGAVLSGLPGAKQAVDALIPANERSISKAFPAALERAIQAAKDLGVAEEDIDGAKQKAQKEKEESLAWLESRRDEIKNLALVIAKGIAKRRGVKNEEKGSSEKTSKEEKPRAEAAAH